MADLAEACVHSLSLSFDTHLTQTFNVYLRGLSAKGLPARGACRLGARSLHHLLGQEHLLYLVHTVNSMTAGEIKLYCDN